MSIMLFTVTPIGASIEQKITAFNADILNKICVSITDTIRQYKELDAALYSFDRVLFMTRSMFTNDQESHIRVSNTFSIFTRSLILNTRLNPSIKFIESPMPVTYVPLEKLVYALEASEKLANSRAESIWKNLQSNSTELPMFDGMQDTLAHWKSVTPPTTLIGRKEFLNTFPIPRSYDTIEL